MTDEAVLEKNCRAGKALCVLAFLPHILDATVAGEPAGRAGVRWSVVNVSQRSAVDCAGREAQLAALRAVTEKFKAHQQIGYLWSEAMQQPALEAALNVGGSGP